MPKSKFRKKTLPKRVLALPHLEHAEVAVLSSLASASGQRTYDHAIREFVAWYCSEPRLAFNRTVVLRYRIRLEQRGYALGDCSLPIRGRPRTETPERTSGHRSLRRGSRFHERSKNVLVCFRCPAAGNR